MKRTFLCTIGTKGCKKKERKYWVHPYIEKYINCRTFIAVKKLQETDAKFLTFYRMSKESYAELVRIISPAVHQRNTHLKECASSEERILITLWYVNNILS